jgi:uncharacterized protein
MYLVDTNIWLERLLEQERAEEVREFLEQVTTGQLLISDFSYHSIGVILHRLKKLPALEKFTQDVFIDGGVGLVSVRPGEISELVKAIELYGFDFDDAYQFVAAEKYQAIIVSFDSDFDRTQRMTPAQIVEQLSQKPD